MSDEEWVCGEGVMLESRSLVRVQAGLLAPWGCLDPPQSVVLISALCQWSFKHPNGLTDWFVWPSVLLFPLAKCR